MFESTRVLLKYMSVHKHMFSFRVQYEELAQSPLCKVHCEHERKGWDIVKWTFPVTIYFRFYPRLQT